MDTKKQPENNDITLSGVCPNCEEAIDINVRATELMVQLKDDHHNVVADFNQKIDWLKQRINDLEDELFIATECDRPKGTVYGDVSPRRGVRDI